jgi:hypothetical protein
MIMSVTMTNGGKVSGPQECAGCNKKIHDKFILKVCHKFLSAANCFQNKQPKIRMMPENIPFLENVKPYKR